MSVTARDLTIDGNGGELSTGITSQAVSGSAGNAGSVDVRVDGALAMVAGGAISSDTLDSGGTITAASTGNVTASNVAVTFGAALTVSDAGISTSAVNGDGGAVSVNGSGILTLQNGQMTTSVTGAKGNGGDISVSTPILVMQTGFIQANTTARNATGGRVAIEVDSLIPSGGTLFVGGSTACAFTPDVFGYNVIQAAAPDGVSGNVRISTPVLDITGSIAALPAKYLDPGGPRRSPCAIAGGSSLAQVGRGGMLPRADAVLLTGTVLDDTGRSAAADLLTGVGVPMAELHGSAALVTSYTIRCDSQSGPNAALSPR